MYCEQDIKFGKLEPGKLNPCKECLHSLLNQNIKICCNGERRIFFLIVSSFRHSSFLFEHTE